MNQDQKQALKDQALTDLFNSQILQKKIEYVCVKHRIPLSADIQSDILQVVFENLVKYPLDKFVDTYNDNPNRIVALATKMILWKGVYVDKRIAKGFNHTIAQQILHASTLNTLEHISSTIEDDTDSFNIPQIALDDDSDDDDNPMWNYVRMSLNKDENDLLNIILAPTYKLKGSQKKLYPQLLEKIKDLITQYNKTKDQ